MSSPVNAQVSGTFTTPATLVPVNISIPSGYTELDLINVTDYNTPAATIIKATGRSSGAAGTAEIWTGNGATPNVLTPAVAITGGFTFISDSSGTALGAPVVATAITAATPAVVSTAAPLAVGDVARNYATTGMLQVAGMDFTVTAIAAGVSQSYGYLPAAGFAAPATAGIFRRVPFDPRFYPRRRFITAISAANPARIQLSVTHGFVVGERVRIICPDAFGMTQINGLLGTVTAESHTIGTGTNWIEVDIDSTAMTAFAFPTSAVAALGVTFAQVVPVGEAATVPYANLLDDATTNLSFSGVQIGTGILVASKNYQWVARRGTAI
ncbi:MAG: hypothetical protein LLG04_19060 [Parachlamydia sp.]|nr:hypothetical protein [Parachlamydia sp.]